MSLLTINTSVVTYDFVEADSAGQFLGGFTTTTLRNSLASGFLRGLTLQLAHDLFEGGGVGGDTPRTFAPHLSQVTLDFSFSSGSALFRALGFLGGGEEGSPAEEAGSAEEEEEEEDLFDDIDEGDESSIVPSDSRSGSPRGRRRGSSSGNVGEWSAQVGYSLTRPREETSVPSEMLQSSIRFQPTRSWNVVWRTSYDLEAGGFNDHTISLVRDLHRWEATFGFLQTATGNWSFRFEVSLSDNRDLKVDYEQRSLSEGVR